MPAAINTCSFIVNDAYKISGYLNFFTFFTDIKGGGRIIFLILAQSTTNIPIAGISTRVYGASSAPVGHRTSFITALCQSLLQLSKLKANRSTVHITCMSLNPPQIRSEQFVPYPQAKAVYQAYVLTVYIIPIACWTAARKTMWL
jgi:hypothetical protein